MTLRVRQALASDATEAVGVLRRSIVELCAADHGDDPAEIEPWLANKTVVGFEAWLAREDAVVLVAERAGRVVGLGMASFTGEILLTHVDPAARFGGVSTAILSALEDRLRAKGVARCRLEATRTARRFYAARGYRGETGSDLMTKPL